MFFASVILKNYNMAVTPFRFIFEQIYSLRAQYWYGPYACDSGHILVKNEYAEYFDS